MPPWLTTIISSGVGVVIAIISSQWFAKKMMHKDTIDEILTRLDTIDGDQKELKKICAKLSDADVALLKDRFEYLSHTAIERGYTNTNEQASIIRLSVPYFEIDDHDGTGHQLLQTVKSLPIKESIEL